MLLEKVIYLNEGMLKYSERLFNLLYNDAALIYTNYWYKRYKEELDFYTNNDKFPLYKNKIISQISETYDEPETFKEILKSNPDNNTNFHEYNLGVYVANSNVESPASYKLHIYFDKYKQDFIIDLIAQDLNNADETFQFDSITVENKSFSKSVQILLNRFYNKHLNKLTKNQLQKIESIRYFFKEINNDEIKNYKKINNYIYGLKYEDFMGYITEEEYNNIYVPLDKNRIVVDYILTDIGTIIDKKEAGLFNLTPKKFASEIKIYLATYKNLIPAYQLKNEIKIIKNVIQHELIHLMQELIQLGKTGLTVFDNDFYKKKYNRKGFGKPSYHIQTHHEYLKDSPHAFYDMEFYTNMHDDYELIKSKLMVTRKTEAFEKFKELVGINKTENTIKRLLNLQNNIPEKYKKAVKEIYKKLKSDKLI
jgi:hypothetical protein